MKKYHVKLRWFCSLCCHYQDQDFHFSTLSSALRFIFQSFFHLDFDVAWLFYDNDIMIHIDCRKEVFKHETQNQKASWS